jgi:imidazolonepropionase-like amidohydrolase
MVLARKVPALVSVERADEIVTAIRLAEEFGFDLHLVGGAGVLAVLHRLAGSGVPMLVGPPGDVALQSETGARVSERASSLRDQGVPFALVTGDDERAPRTDLLDMARAAVRGGLSLRDALESITVTPARILGLGGELGTIEEGKVADLVLFDGQPLEATSRVTAVFVGGAPVYDRQR